MVVASETRCQHENFVTSSKVIRLTDKEGGAVTGFTVDVKVNCANCEMPFQWVGMRRGVSFMEPRMSADCLELRAPIIPLEEL